ncbi:hypothetical protein JCM10212_003807 [Sporobolomyces blumeae]
MTTPRTAVNAVKSLGHPSSCSTRTAARSLSTCSAPRSSSSRSSSPAPPPSRSPPPSSRSNRNKLLYRRVLRTALLGSYELDAASSSTGPTAPYSLRNQGFKPPKVRPTPTSATQSRGRLVEIDREQVVKAGFATEGGESARERRSRLNAAPAAARTKPVLPAKQPKWKRGFATSARAERASEEALEADDDFFAFEGGDWEGKGKGVVEGSSRAKVPQPGDWVETRRNGIPLSGIYICVSAFSSRRFVILPTSGAITELSLDDITYLLPSVVSSELVSPVATVAKTFQPTTDATKREPDFAFDPSDSNILEILQRLREIEFAVEEETKLLVTQGANDLYRLLQAPATAPTRKKGQQRSSEQAPTSVTIPTALRALRLAVASPTASVPLARSIAVHRVLIERPEHFLADPIALRVSGRFDLRAPDEVERFEKVRGWVRGQSDPLIQFVDKAARVREWARRHPPTKATPLSKGGLSRRVLPKGPEFEWTDDDRAILEFFRDTLASDRVLQAQPHMATAPSILKLVDQRSLELGYEGWGQDAMVKKDRVRGFLAEVGDVAPWENWAALEKNAGLKGWTEMGQRVERALAAKSAHATPKQTAPTLGATELYPVDPLDSVRHDFGQATVFTIDDAGAFELDDGVSISPAAPTSTGSRTHWVWVHIADPTALLHPDHLVSKLARVRDHTEYFPEKTWSMLPDSFVEGQGLSLGSMAGKEQRTLSFGMRVDEETGEVLERDVKAGIVRSVLRLTYSAVDEALGYEAPALKSPIQHPVTGPRTAQGSESEPRRTRHLDDHVLASDPEKVASLSTLHRLAAKLLRRRAADSALFWSFPTASVSVSPSLSPSFRTSTRPTFYSSAPQVDLYLPGPLGEQRSFTDSPASLLVSEFMVAANRTAARFSVENDLAVPFRTQGAPNTSPQALDAIMRLRNPATGEAPAIEVLKQGIDFAPGSNSPSTGPHWPMGINDEYGYVKVTSPLRRFSDLFAHWQLKSALLPSSPSSTTPSLSTPRFDRSAVLAYIQGFDAAAKARHRLSDAASTFWSLYVVSHKLSILRRLSSRTSTMSASDVSSADQDFVNLLAGGLTAIPLRLAAHSAFDNLYMQPVLVPQLGIRGTLQVEKAEMAPRVGEEVDIKIDDVLLSARSKLVVSLRSR